MIFLRAFIFVTCCTATLQCAIAAGDEPLSGQVFKLAERAYAAIAQDDLAGAEREVNEALYLQPGNRQLGLLLFDVQLRKGDTVAARKNIDDLVARFPDDALVRVQRGYLAQRQNRHQEAMEDFYTALSRQGLNADQQHNVRLAWADSALVTHQPNVVLDALAPYAQENDLAVQQRLGSARDELSNSHLVEAYRYLREKNDAAAVQAFKRGFVLREGTSGQYGDAGYAAKRIDDNANASAWFRKILDGAPAPDERTAFGYRREIQEMNRHFGAVGSLAYQNGGFGPSSIIDVWQGGLEAYWQPEEGGYRNGKLFQVFVRGYENLYDGGGGTVGADTAQGTFGARYKPISDLSLMFTVEKLFPVGSLAMNDILLRVGYSNGDGSDWNPMTRNWKTWSFYTESAYFTNAARFIQSLEARYGHSWALGDAKWVATPHWVVGGDYDSFALQPTALGWGPGVSFRRWFREDTYQAPASWFDLTMQYRFELTQAPRARGFVLRATLWY